MNKSDTCQENDGDDVSSCTLFSRCDIDRLCAKNCKCLNNS